MISKVFIDTNVLVDVVTARKQPHVPYSQELFAAAVNGEVELFVSALSVVTVVYVAKKYGLSEPAVKSTLKTLLSFINVVDLTSGNIIDMLDSDWSDYEDSTQNESAKQIDADIIATGNVKDFIGSDIKVMTPKQILEIL